MRGLTFAWRLFLVLLYFQASIGYLFNSPTIVGIIAIIIGFYFIVIHELGCWYYHYISEMEFFKPTNWIKKTIFVVTWYCLFLTEWMGVYKLD